MIIQVNRRTVIVFDLDDTLYNEIDFLISAYKHIARSISIKDEKKIFATMFSHYRNGNNVFEYLAKKYNHTTAQLIEDYRSHLPQIQLRPDLPELLQLIRMYDGKIGIITDGRAQTQKNKIKALGLESLIDTYVISEEIGAEKPSKKAFLEIQKKLAGDVYYYIGDNFTKDFIAPKMLGWKTIALIDNGKNIHHSSHLKLEEANKPDEYIYNFNEIHLKQ